MSLSRTILSTQGDAFWLLPRPLSLSSLSFTTSRQIGPQRRCLFSFTKLLFFVVKSCATPSCIYCSIQLDALEHCGCNAANLEHRSQQVTFLCFYPLNAQSDRKIGSEHVVSFILVLYTLFCRLWATSSRHACDDVVLHTESSSSIVHQFSCPFSL